MLRLSVFLDGFSVKTFKFILNEIWNRINFPVVRLRQDSIQADIPNFLFCE